MFWDIPGKLDAALIFQTEWRCTHLESVLLYHYPQEEEENDNRESKASVARIILTLVQRLSEKVEYEHDSTESDASTLHLNLYLYMIKLK